MSTIGLLHPGEMGAAVGDAAVAAGAVVTWLPAGRSPATTDRAGNFVPTTTLDTCDLVISVCPPAAAFEVARFVADSSFTGVFLEANAISPQRSRQIADLLGQRGISVVDGGIVGPPPRRRGTTRLYLSGPAEPVRAVFDGGPLEPVVLPGEIGQASALKLAFACYNKISLALAAQAYGLAESHGVGSELRELAEQALPGTSLNHPDSLRQAAAKAWRWSPEMREIASTCTASAIPADLPLAAATLLDRWSAHKDDDTVPLDQLLADLTTAETRCAKPSTT